MQTASYADEFFQKITGALRGDPDVEVKCFANLWKTATQPSEEALYERLKKRKPKWNLLRQFMVKFVGDALSYQVPSSGGTFKPLELSPTNEAYPDVHQRLDDTLKAAQEWLGEEGELVIVSHSLGTIVANNFIWDVTHPDSAGAKVFVASDEAKAALKKLQLLVTLGSPLALWSLQWEDQGDPISVENWINVWCPTDIIAYPIKDINPAYGAKANYQDVRMYVGGALTFWNPGSHVMYMDSQKVVNMIASSISDEYIDMEYSEFELWNC